MKVLVIPDIHLKPWIFKRAAEHLENNAADRAVCLMDIADDWNKEFFIELYDETYNAAIDFAKTFPETLWCYGNHDISYIINERESGYSPAAAYTVSKKVRELEDVLPADNKIKYVHKIDNVIFSHGGLSNYFIKYNIDNDIYGNEEAVIEAINNMPMNQLWCNESPIWLRPQYDPYTLYRRDEFFQVVGHTPVKAAYEENNVLSCDVFSTYRNGECIGDNRFPVIDTVTHEWNTIL